MNGIKIIFLSLLTLSCLRPSQDGKFIFVNQTESEISISCYFLSMEQFYQKVKPGQSASFSAYIINSHFSFPNQIDSIVIESNGKILAENCPYDEKLGFPARNCKPTQHSFFSFESYTEVDKKRSDAPDYYYYFKEKDLIKLQ